MNGSSSSIEYRVTARRPGIPAGVGYLPAWHLRASPGSADAHAVPKFPVKVPSGSRSSTL